MAYGSEMSTPPTIYKSIAQFIFCYAADNIMVSVVWYMAGDTEENVVKFCQHAGLSDDDRLTIVNLQKLGVPIILEVCPFRCLFFFLMILYFFRLF